MAKAPPPKPPLPTPLSPKQPLPKLALPKSPPELTHLGKTGEARMVDVSGKADTERTAVAEGHVVMRTATLDIVLNGNAVKGDVLAAARLAGIMAAKRTHQLIPLCHRLPGFVVQATVKVTGKTGVEMEALTAVSVACLTIYDMVKAVERGMTIAGIRLLEKQGGKSGHYKAQETAKGTASATAKAAEAKG